MTCLHCGTPIPAGSRRDRVYCNNNCSALASYYRRKSGATPPPRWQHPALGSADPALRAAVARTRQLGETHGWSPSTIRCALDGLTVLLDGRPAGERVTLTEIRTRTPRHTSAPRVAEVLAGLGLLEDDTTPAIRSWIERRAGELPHGFAAAVRAWLLVLLDGDTRARPRSHASIYVYFAAIQPLIEQWTADRGHLREVTAADIKAVLDPLRGHQLRTATVAVRSLFRFAKKRGLVFANPAARLKATDPSGNLLPMTDAEIRAVEQAATSPAQRLIVALAAVHAARWAAIRGLTLNDLDLPNRRITIAGHHQRLGELTYRALRAWLGHRRAIWPHTPNRHVLISEKTALGSVPVTRGYLNWNLQRHGVSIERIRRDRVLHEALTARADPLHLALVFGLSHTTASRYTLIACDLLADQPAEAAGTSSTALPIVGGHEDLLAGGHEEGTVSAHGISRFAGRATGPPPPNPVHSSGQEFAVTGRPGTASSGASHPLAFIPGPDLSVPCPPSPQLPEPRSATSGTRVSRAPGAEARGARIGCSILDTGLSS